MRRILVAILMPMLASCAREPDSRVDAADYDAFWLWAGVTPQLVLARAKTLYLLSGEVRRESGTFVNLRPATPRLSVRNLWLVVRVDTLHWKRITTARVMNEVARWQAAGNSVRGVQIDFDARTRHLDDYAGFLRALRDDLPRSTQLSVTGLMDWGANGDPFVIKRLKGVVDEIVIQTYQGRRTIPDYERYLPRLLRLDVPFKIGLVQGGDWHAAPSLERSPNFRGYVVFLVNTRGRRSRYDGIGDPEAAVHGRFAAPQLRPFVHLVYARFRRGNLIPGSKAVSSRSAVGLTEPSSVVR